MSKYTLDARNLLCPLPVIRTQEYIKTLRDGDELNVVATDPGALHDVPAWCRVHGHSILRSAQGDDECYIDILINKPG